MSNDDEIITVNVPKRKAGRDQLFVAILSIAGFFSIIYAIIFEPIPAENRELLLIILGTLSSGFTGAVGFYLGNAKSNIEN